MQITSPSNARVRTLAKLRDRRERDASKQFLIEGAREVERAVAAGIEVVEVLFCREMAGKERTALVEAMAAGGTVVTHLAAAPFQKVSYRSKGDGIIVVAVQPDVSLDRLQPPAGSITLLVEAIEKPGNLGAMIRTADAAGCYGVVAADPVVDLFNPNVVRAAQGSLFALPVATAAPAAVIRWARRHDMRLIAADPAADRELWEADLDGSIGILIGSEHAGLSAGWRDVAEFVAIPMSGSADSLNASVAAAVMLYEAARRRAGTGPRSGLDETP